jgi:RNA polymerase sigma-70 factor (ECF subfamily)
LSRVTLTFSALENSSAHRDDLVDRFSAEGRWVSPPAMWQEQDPEDLLLRRETVACLEGAIASLPPAQRAVVTLIDIEGVDADEDCNILAITRLISGFSCTGPERGFARRWSSI